MWTGTPACIVDPGRSQRDLLPIESIKQRKVADAGYQAREKGIPTLENRRATAHIPQIRDV